jgi:hypothetical protein
MIRIAVINFCFISRNCNIHLQRAYFLTRLLRVEITSNLNESEDTATISYQQTYVIKEKIYKEAFLFNIYLKANISFPLNVF